jgi:biopolymer transport protein ExbB
VAPGIAEALIATAIGLAAAIPAVLIYNSLARSIAGYRRLLSEAAVLTACVLSREVAVLEGRGQDGDAAQRGGACGDKVVALSPAPVEAGGR